jgi:hypothetical protein
VGALAVCAIGALGVSSASAALPEFVGQGEISSTHPVKYTFKGGSVAFSVPGIENIVQCASSTGEGSITGPKTLTARLTLEGCKQGVVSCQSGGVQGRVVTEELKSALVYISKATKVVGIDLNQYEGKLPPPLPVFATLVCGNSKEGINDAAIAPITPINTKGKAFTLKLAGKLGVQSPAEYENEKAEKVRQVFAANLIGGYPESLREAAVQTEGKMEGLTWGGKAMEVEVKA